MKLEKLTNRTSSPLSNCRIAVLSKHLFLLLLVTSNLLLVSHPTLAQDFGPITNPLSKVGDGAGYGEINTPGGGMVGFISNIIKVITVGAGLFSMFNFIVAGLDYITSQGDPKGTESARNKIKQSIIGLVIIAGTFTLTAIASQVLFGNFNAILNPTIYGPGQLSTP